MDKPFPLQAVEGTKMAVVTLDDGTILESKCPASLLQEVNVPAAKKSAKAKRLAKCKAKAKAKTKATVVKKPSAVDPAPVEPASSVERAAPVEPAESSAIIYDGASSRLKITLANCRDSSYIQVKKALEPWRLVVEVTKKASANYIKMVEELEKSLNERLAKRAWTLEELKAEAKMLKGAFLDAEKERCWRLGLCLCCKLT